MLKQRIITALIIVAFFLAGLFLLTLQSFSVAIGLIVVYAAWEWSDMAGLSSRFWRISFVGSMAVMLAVTAGLTGFLLQSGPNIEVAKVFLLTGCLWWLVAFFLVRGYPGNEILWGSCWVRSIMGALVLLPTWVAVTALIHLDNGTWLLLLAILIVVLADVGAYFTGKRFGKNKLAPGVSPGKTWEGFWGGMASNLVLALVLGATLGLSISAWGWLMLVIMVTSAASVLGDLLESMLKRHRGIKDSGTILPGHGGVMDRVDSLSAALPVFALLYLSTNLNL